MVKTGHEIDYNYEYSRKVTPMEVKSGKTFQPDFLQNINYWKKISPVTSSVLLCGGEQQQQHSDGTLITNWRESAQLEF